MSEAAEEGGPVTDASSRMGSVADGTLTAARDALLRATVVVPHTDADGLAAGALALLDWGMRALDHPALIVDHHAPEADPADGQLLLSGFGEQSETTTAALVRRLVPGQPAWLAAVGAVGDLGDGGFALPECVAAPRTGGAEARAARQRTRLV